MHHLIKSVYRQIHKAMFGAIVLLTLSGVGAWALLTMILPGMKPILSAAIMCGLLVLLGGIFMWIVTRLAFAPFEQLSRAILHVSRVEENVAAPALDSLKLGRAQVTELSQAAYDLAISHNSTSAPSNATTDAAMKRLVLQAPLPMLAIDKQNRVALANPACLEYVGMSSEQLVGSPVSEIMRLVFPKTVTLQEWMDDCRANKLVDTISWERVRLLNQQSNPMRQFDMAAHYSKANDSDIDTVIGMFDKTTRYAADDQDLSFVAIAIHELRTPITMMRGYIELFEDEIGPSLNAELTEFMQKMSAAGNSLTTFVSNILNVARIENNQLQVQLAEADWNKTLQKSCADLNLRARVRGKTIEYQLAENLPTVAVDGASIFEVLNNLVENAIKYSGQSNRIIIKTFPYQNMVATTVQDFGIGVPATLLPHLFEKFYRSHRSRTSVSGTGLGLYVCKAIIDAHGGRIWVESTEGRGSAFSFLLPNYASIAANPQSSNNEGITREAHGWIKNHNLLR